MKTPKMVKCVQCKKQFDYYSSEFRPFCSERCKMVDLGHWLEEDYALPSKEPLSEHDIEEVLINEKDKPH